MEFRMPIRDDVLTTAALIAEDPSADEQEIVWRLVARGYDRLRAELLISLVPLGLARAVIARLPAYPPIQLSDTALIRDHASNRTLEVSLAQIPEFEIARQLGEETFASGVMPREQFTAATGRSVELNLLNQALTAGADVGAAKIASPILIRLAEVPEFEDWYRELMHIKLSSP